MPEHGVNQMKITFLLPGSDLSGGARAVLEHANRLQKKGHDVSVVYPLVPLGSGTQAYQIKKFLRGVSILATNLGKGNNVGWFDLKARFLRVPMLLERFIPDADIVVATWWATAYYVNKYGPSKGTKFYFIQSYETWGGPEAKVNHTYKMKLHKIVISTWLRNIMENRFHEKVAALVPDGIDLEIFHPEKNRDYGNKRVLMCYQPQKLKGIKDGLKAWEIIKRKVPGAQLVMFGLKKGKDVPDDVEFHRYTSDDQLRKIYNSCDVFLFTSHLEGFGLPPIEAMACGCAVVTTNVGAVPDYTIPNETALVCAPGDAESLARNAIALLKDADMLRSIAHRGHDYVQRFSWDTSAAQLEKVFWQSLHNSKPMGN
jgi:glycosyltransferase involved in cell wall biosynthesis